MKHQRFSFSGTIDDTIDAELVKKALPDPVNADEFCNWLATEIGRFRFMTKAEGNMPARSKELDVLRDATARLRAAGSVLAPEALPPHARAVLKEVFYGPGRPSFDDVREAVAIDLHTLVAAFEIAMSKIDATPKKAGRKSATTRDKLLLAIVGKLEAAGLSASPARAIAAEVLAACQVYTPAGTPDDDRARRRAVARVGHK